MARKSSDAEDVIAWNCFVVEKELGVIITPEYPVSKFLLQMKYLDDYNKEERRQMEKASSSVRIPHR